MNKRIFSVAVLALLQSSFFALQSSAQSDNDFGMDYTVGVDKKICKAVDFDLDFELRTQNNNKDIEYWSVGGAFDFKLYGSKKFDVKATAGWRFMRQYNLASLEYKYGNDLYNEETGMYDLYGEKGYNSNKAYWRNRHRTTVGVSADYKPTKRWTFSLKETVQYNHYAATDSIFWKNRLKYNDDDEAYRTQTVSAKSAKDKFVLRSKLSAQYDVKHSVFAPFASVDYGCGLNYTANKLKATVGTDIKINKHNKFNVFYRFQTEDDDDEPNGHLIGVGYNFKF